MPVNFETLRPGSLTIGGVQFNFTADGDGFDIEIPAINAYYTNLIGSRTHSIIPSIAAIDAMIAQMRGFQSKNYGLLLSSHDIARNIDVAAEKIAYFERVKTIIASSNNRAAFTEAMNTAFPNYGGANFLGMSANALFTN
jgi:hypothetical protein